MSQKSMTVSDLTHTSLNGSWSEEDDGEQVGEESDPDDQDELDMAENCWESWLNLRSSDDTPQTL